MTTHSTPGKINQTILIMDSDPAYRAFIQEFLLEEGYTRVLCVPSDGIDEAVRRERPGVMLLEVHAAWPASGLRLLDRLRRDPITAATPIIICTTTSSPVAAQAAAQRCDILEKPFQLEDLLTRLRASIGLPAHAKPTE